MSIIDNLSKFETALNKRYKNKVTNIKVNIGDEIPLPQPGLRVYIPNPFYRNYGSFDPANNIQPCTGIIIGYASVEGVFSKLPLSTGYPLIVRSEDYPACKAKINALLFLRDLPVTLYALPSHYLELKGLNIKLNVAN